MAWLSRLGRRGRPVRRSGEELGDDPFGEVVVQRSPADAQAVPDQRGTDVGEQGHVGVGSDLASGHSTGQHIADDGLPVAEEGGPEGLGQHRMASLLGDQGLHQVASRLDHVEEAVQHLDQVAPDAAGVGRRQLVASAPQEGVDDQVGLVVPPAVDGRLGHTGAGGDALDAQAGKSLFDQQVQGGGLDGPVAGPVPGPAAMGSVAGVDRSIVRQDLGGRVRHRRRAPCRPKPGESAARRAWLRQPARPLHQPPGPGAR